MKAVDLDPRQNTVILPTNHSLKEAWTDEDQRMVHKNPSVQDLKRLSRHARYHSARFVIYKDGSLVAADSEHYTHHSMAPAMGAWDVRGYVTYMGDNDWAYRSMEVYSPQNKDHPLFRKWEASGIENGNPKFVEESKTNPGELYHGTLIDNVPNILQSGLTPRAGHITTSIYKDRAKPLVFAADIQGATRVYCALVSQILNKLGHMPNAAEMSQHGALLIIRNDVSKFRQYPVDAKRRKGSVEAGDWYSVEPVHVDTVIKGDDLVKWIKQHNLDQQVCYPLLEMDQDTKISKNSTTIKKLAQGVGKQYGQVYEQQLNEAWSKKYKKSIDCNNPKGFSQRAHCAGRRKRRAGGQTSSKSVSEASLDQLVENMLVGLVAGGLTESQAVNSIDQQLDEDLRKWFREKWVRFGPDGKIRGACARGSEGEGKPKCLPQRKAWALGKKQRATAARRKRRQDPNPEREGKARNVATKESVTGVKLGDLCTIKTNFPDADFWLVRRTDRKNVGKPVREFSPYHVGIKVRDTDKLDSRYLYYVMTHLFNRGYWAEHSYGMSNLVHIRTDDVKNIALALQEDSIKQNQSLQETWQHTVDINQLAAICAKWIESQKPQGQTKTQEVAQLAKKAGIFSNLTKDTQKYILDDHFDRNPLTITVDFASPEGAMYGYYEKNHHNIRIFYKSAKSFGLAEAIAHELQHAIDEIRVAWSAYQGDPVKVTDMASFRKYLKDPSEINARLASVLFQLSQMNITTQQLPKALATLLDQHHLSPRGEYALSNTKYKKLLSRSYKFYANSKTLQQQQPAKTMWEKIKYYAARVAEAVLGPDINESFDREEFLRHMAKLRAREELRKTDPVKALVQDLKDQDKQPPAKKSSDDSDLGDPNIDPLAESLKQCPHCGGPVVSEQELEEKQDACYYKVKSRYKVWPSAYASGALVQCRKKGAKNWGKSKTNESISIDQQEEHGGLEAYITDTSTPQLVNYLASENAPADIAEKLQRRYKTIAVFKNIWVEEDHQGSGVGSWILEAGIGDAIDNQAHAVILTAVSDDPKRQSQLEKWYKSYDFKEIARSSTGYPVMLLDLNKDQVSEAAPWLGQGDEPLPTKLYHVTRTRNRLSIRQRGLVPKTKEHDHILRQPGVFGFETFEQAEDWAYYWSQDEGESMDIWEIDVPDPNELTPDPARDIQTEYDAWIIYKPIPASNLRLKFTQRWPAPWGKPTLTVKKLRNLEEDPDETQ